MKVLLQVTVILITEIVILNATLIPLNSNQIFNYESFVNVQEFNENLPRTTLKITSQLQAQSIWNKEDKQLLRLKLKNVAIDTVGKKEIGSDKLNAVEYPFYMLYDNNQPTALYLSKSLTTAQRNLCKGIGSLFYISQHEGKITEEDVSGVCTVYYRKISSSKIKKTKESCSNWRVGIHRRLQKVLDIDVKSNYQAEYELTSDGTLKTFISVEKHSYQIAMSHKLNGYVESVTSLTFVRTENIQSELQEIETILSELDKTTFVAEEDDNKPKQQESLEEMIRLHGEKLVSRGELDNDQREKWRQSDVFLILLPHFRTASKDELGKVVESPANEKILSRLVDLLGAASSKTAHDIVKSKFSFKKNTDIFILERYIQALASGTRVNEYIIHDLLVRLQNKTIEDERLEESTALALCSLAYRLKHDLLDSEQDLYKDIKDYVMNKLQLCKENECKAVHLRCLQNLLDESTVPTLLEFAFSDSSVASVAAMKALKAFPSVVFTEENKYNFKRMLYQTIKKTDSSARTLAFDIFLSMNLNTGEMSELLQFLLRNEELPEMRTYAIQRLQMLAENSPDFASLLKNVLRNITANYDYNLLSKQGLTTVLRRSYSSSLLLNGTLISTQEVEKGVLKRGLVEISVSNNEAEASVFTLGLYTKGLSSFVGDSTDSDSSSDSSEDDTVTAGMELNLLGSQMRPFSFFNGQGELMGHVWSGTASEPTSAYESTVLIHDHETQVLLHNGAAVSLQIVSAYSIDLFGSINFSIWNRNAHAEINKNSEWTLSAKSTISILAEEIVYIFTSSINPNMVLIADIDFYSDVKLCIQLQRLDSDLRVGSSCVAADNNVKSYTQKSPGFTMALNKKNNEMCNAILSVW